MFYTFNLKPTSIKDGFTIIELILVIILVGILSTIAIISFNRQIKSAHLKQAAQEFVNFAKFVKSTSLSSSSPCILVVNHEEAQLTISNPVECTKDETLNILDDSKNLQDLVVCGTNNTSRFDMNCDLRNNGSDVDINGITKMSTIIEFTPKGSVSKGALVKIYSPDLKHGYCIIITSPVGLIRKTRIDENTCDFTA